MSKPIQPTDSDPKPSPREYAELLWLEDLFSFRAEVSQNPESGESELPEVADDSDPLEDSERRESEIRDSDTPEPSSGVGESPSQLFDPSQSPSSAEKVTGERTHLFFGEQSPLANPLSHQRALHRLIPPREKSWDRQIDLAETVRQTAAAGGHLQLNFHYPKERLGHLVIIISDGVALAPWYPVIEQYRRLAQTCGAFRSISRDVIRIPAHADRDFPDTPTGIRPGKDNLILLIHDGLGDGMIRGTLGHYLQGLVRGLHQQAKIAWLHPWQESTWPRTSVSRLPVGSVESADEDSLVVPIIPIEKGPQSEAGLKALEGWFTDQRISGVRARKLPVSEPVKSEKDQREPVEKSEEEWCTRFQRLVDTSGRLAGKLLCLAASFNGSFSVKALTAVAEELRQKQLLKGGGDIREPFANAITSGFLKRANDQRSTNGLPEKTEEIALVFHPNARRAVLSKMDLEDFNTIREVISQSGHEQIPGKKSVQVDLERSAESGAGSDLISKPEVDLEHLKTEKERDELSENNLESTPPKDKATSDQGDGRTDGNHKQNPSSVNYKVEITDSFSKELTQAPRKISKKVTESYGILRSQPKGPHDKIKKLQMWKDFYRFRIGDYRFAYHVCDKEKAVKLIALAKRDNFYKKIGHDEANNRPTHRVVADVDLHDLLEENHAPEETLNLSNDRDSNPEESKTESGGWWQNIKDATSGFVDKITRTGLENLKVEILKKLQKEMEAGDRKPEDILELKEKFERVHRLDPQAILSTSEQLRDWGLIEEQGRLLELATSEGLNEAKVEYARWMMRSAKNREDQVRSEKLLLELVVEDEENTARMAMETLSILVPSSQSANDSWVSTRDIRIYFWRTVDSGELYKDYEFNSRHKVSTDGQYQQAATYRISDGEIVLQWIPSEVKLVLRNKDQGKMKQFSSQMGDVRKLDVGLESGLFLEQKTSLDWGEFEFSVKLYRHDRWEARNVAEVMSRMFGSMVETWNALQKPAGSLLPLDAIVDKVVALGVPGLVLLVVMATTGYAGAAAITVSLATLGGPMGMLGGVGVLGILALLSKAGAEYGFEEIYCVYLSKQLENGRTVADLKNEIHQSYLTKSLKNKVISFIEEMEKKNPDSLPVFDSSSVKQEEEEIPMSPEVAIHPFWGEFFRRGVPMHPELEGLTPTGNMTKIGPSIGNRVQIDIDWTGNGVRLRPLSSKPENLRPLLVDREAFEKEVGVPEAWKDGGEKFLSITLLPAPKAIQATWSTERQLTETLELYGRIKKYLQARM